MVWAGAVEVVGAGAAIVSAGCSVGVVSGGGGCVGLSGISIG